MMTPETVFKDKTNKQEPNSKRLSGSNIGPVKIDVPTPPSTDEVEKHLDLYFSQYPKIEQFYKMMKHYGRISKSKTDAKDQFEKIIEIYISSVKQCIKTEEESDKLEDIQKTTQETKKLLADFIDDGKVSNDYFKAGLAALLVNLI